MRSPLRLLLPAFCGDFALYLVMVALPFEVIARGGSPFVLGLIPALYAGTYSLMALVAGRASDRLPRRVLARLGCFLAAASAVAMSRTQDLTGLLVLVPPVGVGLGMFWAPLQATVGDLARGGQLGAKVGWFNVGWSTGKALGFLTGGALLAAVGAPIVTLVAAAAWVVAGLLFPPSDNAVAEQHVPRNETTAHESADRFRVVAWIANGATFGLVATINHHLPRLVVARDESSGLFGAFLGVAFLVQTATFVWLGRWSGWHFRGKLLVGAQLGLAALAVIVPASAMWIRVVALAPALGMALGLAYASSLYYSLHTQDNRGRNTGAHESILGVASVVIPFLGGWAALQLNATYAPFWLAAVALTLSAGVSLQLLGRGD